MTNFSALGLFKLGEVQLGAAFGEVTLYEAMTITEAEPIMDMSIEETEETITITDSERIDMSLEELEETIISLTETFGDYPAMGYMGILGKIVLRMDVDSADFCRLAAESGQSLTVNGSPERSFLQVQQSKRTYNPGISIYPGDAVMYSCPENDHWLMVGDIVIHDQIAYKIIAIQNSFFNGNMIYRESGLMRVRPEQELTQVQGLMISDNYEGKTTLTWDEINNDILSHYEIWESQQTTVIDTVLETILDLANTNLKLDCDYPGTPADPNRYIADQLFALHDSLENNGDYVVSVYGDSGYGKGMITIPWMLSTDAPYGTIWNLQYKWLRTKCKNNSITLKNLIPNVAYYYLVRAVDVYGNKGKFSVEGVTPIKTIGVIQVEGLR